MVLIIISGSVGIVGFVLGSAGEPNVCPTMVHTTENSEVGKEIS